MLHKELIAQIERDMPWINGIKSKEKYEELIQLMDRLVESPDENETLINLLFPVIESYEQRMPLYKSCDTAVGDMAASTSMLVVIMDQHGLKQSDFPEIGTKSYVSRILSGERSLSVKHIRSLSQRFNVPPYLFF